MPAVVLCNVHIYHFAVRERERDVLGDSVEIGKIGRELKGLACISQPPLSKISCEGSSKGQWRGDSVNVTDQT